MKRLLGMLATLLVLIPLTSLAQENPMMPRGRWWKMPEVTKRLDLTAEQQEKLDAVFTKRSKELIDLKATMEKSAIELRSSLENHESSPAEVKKFAAEVGEARSQLFKKEVEMMLDMRSELTEEQWTKLRSAIDQRSRRMGDSRRPPQHPSVPPKQD